MTYGRAGRVGARYSGRGEWGWPLQVTTAHGTASDSGRGELRVTRAAAPQRRAAASDWAAASDEGPQGVTCCRASASQ